MSRPRRYLKNSKQFKVVFENLAQNLIENGSRMEKELGIVGNRKIRVILEKVVENETSYIGIFLGHEKRDDEEGEDKIEAVEKEAVFVVMGMQWIVANVIEKKGSHRSNEERGVKDLQELEEILDESNGYLKDGALTLHIEIRTDCLIGKDGIRRFNFHDPFENAIRITDANWDSDLYCPKCIFLHHCNHPWFRNVPDSISLSAETENRNMKPYADMFLQILNGVRLRDISPDEASSLFSFALCLKADTVIRFCEEWMIRNVPNRLKIFQFFGTHSKCLLKWALKDPVDRGTVYDVAEILESSDGKVMKTEHMKAVVKKMFSFA